jgi:outer membrane protein
MKKLTQLCLILFLSLGVIPLLHAADLLDVYLQALDNDPVFKIAYSEFMSDSQNVPRARAPLLPQFTVNALTSFSRQNVNAGILLEDPATDTNAVFIIDEGYRTMQWQFSASQAIYNFKAWAEVQEAKASVKSANALFNDASQNLLLRVTEAYLNVLFSHDSLSFVDAKKRANKRQFDQATQRFNVGLDAITSVYDAQAAYDAAVSQAIEAENNVINTGEELRKLTNHIYDNLSPLRDQKIPLIRPEPDNIDDWVATGLKQNYKLFAAKYHMEEKREKVKVKSAGNWPILAIKGNLTRTRNESQDPNFFIPATQQISSVALTFDYPILQGGLVLAETKQAQFDYQKASQELEQAYRDVTTNSRIAFNTINNGIAKVKADRKTLFTQTASLESTEAGFFVGTRNMVDVVGAQERLFRAQKELASDQYGVIKFMIQLKYLAGTLNVTDLEEINSWLTTERINSRPPQLNTSQ